MRKQALGSDPLSWITSTVRREPPLKRKPAAGPETRSGVPKFKTFDVRLTVLFREDQLNFLDKLVRDVNKNRTSEYRKERITKNTLVRCMLDAFTDTKFNLENVPDEKVLAVRIKEKIRK